MDALAGVVHCRCVHCRCVHAVSSKRDGSLLLHMAIESSLHSNHATPGCDISVVMQIASTLIAAIGFNGYDYPTGNSFDNCQFCRLSYKSSEGGYPAFFGRKVPQARTENTYLASTIGCT